MTIEDSLKKHTLSLMSLPGVVGTGQGLRDGSPCITVFVIRKTPELERKIPRELDRFPVKIEATGRVDALPAIPPPRPDPASRSTPKPLTEEYKDYILPV
jgi:hypothetical protein